MYNNIINWNEANEEEALRKPVKKQDQKSGTHLNRIKKLEYGLIIAVLNLTNWHWMCVSLYV